MTARSSKPNPPAAWWTDAPATTASTGARTTHASAKPNKAKLSLEPNGEAPKVLHCPACARTNPAHAFYCYFDGKPLFKELQQTPLHLGSLLFPTPFCFSNGQACTNFNQLALACTNLWDEARELLAGGIWTTFFAAMGRQDLALAARQASQVADPDQGLTQLLEKFPADAEFLRLPKLGLGAAEVQLDKVAPGTDYTFDLVIQNQGNLVLHGMVVSNFEWLVFGDPVKPTATGPVNARICEEPLVHGGWPREKMFQTRTGCTIPVFILGSKLRAGLKPMLGDIIVDSNGGAATLPVRLDVPIRPFPRGVYGSDVLADVRTPRELAVKAKKAPKEAGALFEQGAVKAWYASNGWTYPIDGSVGVGAGAVQHFFEVLGLTSAPRLEIDTRGITVSGRVGDVLCAQVTLRAVEPKPLHAQAWSNQEWVQPGPFKYVGNKVQIPLRIVVPVGLGDTPEARITIQGNGQQRFVVPVQVSPW